MGWDTYGNQHSYEHPATMGQESTGLQVRGAQHPVGSEVNRAVLFEDRPYLPRGPSRCLARAAAAGGRLSPIRSDPLQIVLIRACLYTDVAPARTSR